MVQIFLASDFHFERGKNLQYFKMKVPQTADIILVPGDVSYGEHVFEHLKRIFGTYGKPVISFYPFNKFLSLLKRIDSSTLSNEVNSKNDALLSRMLECKS